MQILCLYFLALIFHLLIGINLANALLLNSDGGYVPGKLTFDVLYGFFKCNYKSGNFTANSVYEKNRDLFLSNLPLNVTKNEDFLNTTIGQGTNKFYGQAFCRYDIAEEDCYKCLDSAVAYINENCSTSIEVNIWLEDPCHIRYGNYSFFGKLETDSSSLRSARNIDDLPSYIDEEEFDQIWGNMMSNLATRSSMGTFKAKFASNETAVSNETIYALMQCTPDLTQQDCSSCLQSAVIYIKGFTRGRRGSLVLMPSCTFRWELYPFYDSDPEVPIAPSSSPTPLPSISQSSGNNSTSNCRECQESGGICGFDDTNFHFKCFCTDRSHSKSCKPNSGRRSLVAEIAVPTIFSLALLALIAYYRHKLVLICARFRRKKSKKPTNVGYEKFTIGNIRKATNNFSNKIGEGGFGCVYKGILPGGQEVAVKKLSFKSQGEAQFENEVKLLARLHHRNLVRLLGFRFERNEKLLVYEFIPNSSLHSFIFDEKKRIQLVWKTRYKIIVGIARGLVYLHEDSPLRIIHRDLKLSNILLDEYMDPKIADFGMAKLFALDQSEDATTNVTGTFGYMAPEYLIRGVVSMKSDVYSYGVVLLEIISGRSSQTREQRADLLVNAWDNWNKQSPSNIIDPILKEASRSEILRCIQIAFICLQEDPEARPHMKLVTLMLDSNTVALPKPSKPGNLVHIYREQRLTSFPRQIELAPDAGSEYADSGKLEKSVNEVPRIPLVPR